MSKAQRSNDVSNSLSHASAHSTSGGLRRRDLLIGSVAMPLMLNTAHAATSPDAFPSRPIKLIVPFTPGSIGDLFMRAALPQIGTSLGQPVVIDNRAGATSAIGGELAAHSAPDGYTLFLGTQAGLVLNTIARKKMPFDPINDFTPIAMMFVAPMYLYVNPSLPVKTVPDLIALAKSQPGKLTFASIGAATSSHLLGEMFKKGAGVDMLHVPFKGGPEATNALVSGQVDVYFNGANVMPQARQGKVRVIASCGLKRSEERPDLPTVAESGLPGFEVLPWFGLFGPANVPRPIVERLNQDFVATLKTPEMAQKASQIGVEVSIASPESLGARMKSEFAMMTPVMRGAGIMPE